MRVDRDDVVLPYVATSPEMQPPQCHPVIASEAKQSVLAEIASSLRSSQ
jgi:hypothetical protein